MKKKLEAELISIAHRILKMKNKEDVHELHHEAQKLFEKLSVLLFVEENFDSVKPTIGIREIEEKLERAFDFDDKIVVAELTEEKGDIKVIEKTVSQEKEKKEDKSFEKPAESPKAEILSPEIKTEVKTDLPKKEVAPTIEIPTPDKKQISFDDLLNSVQPDVVFERVRETKKEEIIPAEVSKFIDTKIDSEAKEKVAITTEFVSESKDASSEKEAAANLNDKLTKNANLTLNDRVAFEQNLFDGSAEDLNRVISQVATLDSYEDAKNFIDEMVKPDYNDWQGKEEFSTRFMEFIKTKFA